MSNTANIITRRKIARKRNAGACDQNQLEAAIIRYQSARMAQQPSSLNTAYAEICGLYPPLNFVHVWFKKYRYLYDTREDFIQDYLRVFCTALAAWKPRQQRSVSRYNGTGDFKNYFWGALHHNYINMVKADASGKRNLSCRCPICDVWCNPLSTHLLNSHTELLWEQIATYGQNVDTLESCPFCESFKSPRTIPCTHQIGEPCIECKHQAIQTALRRHLVSMHSTHLFDRFQGLYPMHATLSPRPTSVYENACEHESDDEICIYDNTPTPLKITELLATSLTSIQREMINHVFNGSSSITFDTNLYNCDAETFNKELNDLRLKMSLCGLDGGN